MGHFALLEPVEVIPGFDNVAVVSNAIQEGGSHLSIAEGLYRFPETSG